MNLLFQKLQLIILFSMMFGSLNTVFAGSLLDPSIVCKGGSKSHSYEAVSCYDGRNGYTWSCNNCEIQDNNGYWKSYVIIGRSNGRIRQVRFLNSSGSSATISVSGSGCIGCQCSWQKTVSFNPPAHQAILTGDNQLMNCGGYSNFYNISGLSSGWFTAGTSGNSGGLNTYASGGGSPTGYVKVWPSSGSSSGNKTFWGGIYWVDNASNHCYQTNIYKTITVVYPNLNITGATQICPGGLYQYYATFDGATEPVPSTSYSWTYPSGYYSLNGNSNYSLNLQAPQQNPQGGAVNVNVILPCGTYNNGLTIYPYCYGGYSYSVNPNPTFSELIVEIESSEGDEDLFQSANENKVLLILTDEAGSVVKQKKLKGKKEKIDVHQLKPDIYYVKILVNGYEIDNTKRIVKK